VSQNFYKTPLHNNSSSGLILRKLTDLPLSENVAPGLIHYDNQFYPFNYDLVNNPLFFSSCGIDNTTLHSTLKFNILFYQILIYTSLYNINRI